MSGPRDPHAGSTSATHGPPPAGARLVVLAVHGRNAAPANILTLAEALDLEGVAWVAPAAVGNAWYPSPFIAPIADNEPWLSSALALLARTVDALERDGVPSDRIVLLGFSQGACLAGEFAVRHSRRWGGVAMLSGGLIGPPGTTWPETGHFDGTPVFLGCSDVDGHIPKDRVEESAAVFRRMGAVVDMRLYPGMGHMINDDELATVRAMLEKGHRT